MRLQTRTAHARIAGLALVAIALTGCGASAPTPTPAPSFTQAPVVTPAPTPAPTPLANPSLILATTTSTQDSGLLDVLVPAFEAATGYTVKTVAVGSGQAIKMGETGDADVLLVHSPAAEKTFMETGKGLSRTLVMHNSFLIVGPAADPAGIKGMTSAVDAFKKIQAAGATFVSRGDGSGTETKELGYWKKAGIEPAGDWYLQAGQGMGATLRIASEKTAYTLVDIATWAATKKDLALAELVTDDASLLNPYHVIPISATAFPKVNEAGGQAFAEFLLSADVQAMIGAFGQDTFGMQLFVPDAGKTESDLAKP